MYWITITMAFLYAKTDDGLELPIVDITDPAFDADDSNEVELTREFVRGDRWIVRTLSRLVAPLVLSGSRLGAEIRKSNGTFLSGMGTYFMKLGPDQLGPWAKPIDRRIVASLPALALRWRLRDMAELIADALDGSTRNVQLVNIAGGPSLDSLNALVLRKHELAGRSIEVTVLDADLHGPAFGARALEAWKGKGGPLDGVDVSFRHLDHDWTHTDALEALLGADADVIVSSEGGLFEYGSDAAIVRNLEALRGRVRAVVGSVTRADLPMQVMKRQSAAATIPRGIHVFRTLAEKSGFAIDRVIERPFSDHVKLIST